MTPRLSVFSCCIVLCCSSFACAAGGIVDTGLDKQERVFPERNVKYAEVNTFPGWKVDWDQARALYHQGKVGQALVQYELLLQKKSTIDEARWEYATLLIQEKRWQQAGKELDTLLAHEPANQKFLFAKAAVYLQEELGEQAGALYQQLYKNNPLGDRSLEALAGWIAALEMQDKREEQLPLLEQLFLRKPGDLELVKKIARLALETDRPAEAIEILDNPLQGYPRDIELLRLFAQAQEQQGDRERAAMTWQQIAALVPDDVPANKWLAAYYQEKGSSGMALVHVERQLKLDPGSVELLLAASRLHRTMRHLGKALDYQNFYLDLVPDDQNVLKERDETRAQFAADLIALVEHRKVGLLWQDLEKVTSDRAGVYLKMAEMLRAQGKEKELTEVLLLIHPCYPEDRKLYRELVSLLEAQGRSGELVKLQ